MTTGPVRVGQLDTDSIGSRWLLLCGGVTKQSHRRGRRVAESALASGLDVVWFDGLDDRDPSPDSAGLTGAWSNALIVDYTQDLANTLAGRLRASTLRGSTFISRNLWRLRRRLGSLLLSRACWVTIRPDVLRLAEHSPPVAIVYTEDRAITSAWYASRIWPSVPVSTELPGPA